MVFFLCGALVNFLIDILIFNGGKPHLLLECQTFFLELLVDALIVNNLKQYVK